MSVLLRGLWSGAVVLLGFGAVGIASSSFSDSDVAEKSVGIRCCNSLLGLRPSLEDFFFPNFGMIGFLGEEKKELPSVCCANLEKWELEGESF